MPYVKVGARHQITIPQDLRERSGIGAGDLLEIVSKQGRLVLTPTQTAPRPAVPKLSDQEQDLVLSAKQKIAAI